MKPDWASEDVVIDKLLRAHIGRPGGQVASCPGFDPDLANAYVEQVLNSAERGRYEIHLAECTDCRASILTLAQLADVPPYGVNVDLAPTASSEVEAGSGWREGVAAFFGRLARPQWAAVAGLALFALVVIPLLVLRLSAAKHDSVQLAREAQSSQAAPVNPTGTFDESSAPPTPQPGETHAQPGASAAGPEKVGAAGDVAASGEGRKGAAAGGTGGAAASDKPEQPSESTTLAEVAPAPPPVRTRDDEDTASKDARSEPVKKESRGEAERAAPASRARESATSNEPPLPKISQDKALHLPEEKGTNEVDVLKGVSVRDDVHPKEKSGTIKSQDAPPTDTSADASSPRRVAAQPSGRALAGGRTGEEASRAPAPATTAGKPDKGERRIEGKRFRLVNGVWTDRSYKPDGAMAAVTVVSNSDVYNQLIEREAGLKTYLSHFGPEERAVIVYKKIAYKLVPKETKN
jgi:hypothetical protein